MRGAPAEYDRIAAMGKWLLNFVAIGVVSGLGAVVFHLLCEGGSFLFMDCLAGYLPPVPAGERHLLPSSGEPFNRYVLLLLPALGVIGFWLSQTLGFGYGFVQMALDGDVSVWLLATLCVGKILTTSLTIGSGGSGGVFGPSVVIGGAAGALVGIFFLQVMPAVVPEPETFELVGMAGFFTGVSNTPISTIIFISEMSNSYELLLPSLLVCSLTYLLSKRWTIYTSQVDGPVDSPSMKGRCSRTCCRSSRPRT